jgi:hypothetical protein
MSIEAVPFNLQTGVGLTQRRQDAKAQGFINRRQLTSLVNTHAWLLPGQALLDSAFAPLRLCVNAV